MLTLADHLAVVEARRFVGRDAELARLGVLSDRDSPIRIGFVHGPGGIGKSVLLGAFGRENEDRATVRRIDGRLIEPTPGALERAIGDLRRAELPIVVIDSFESIENLDGFLRTDVLPSLPAATRLLVAGRRPPTAGWRRDGWGAVMTEVELGPLTDGETRALLARENIEDPRAVERLTVWSRGEPLAISLAAETLRSDPSLEPDRLDSDERIAEALIRHMGAGDFDQALLAAAIARSVDQALLEDVLGADLGAASYDRLAGLSFSEPYGGRVTLHERLRIAVKTVARVRDAEAARTTRARVADHLDRRIRGGEPELIAELTSLIEDPVVRWGIDGGEAHRADVVRPGDRERAVRLGEDRDPELWPWVERFFDEAPERVVVARDELGQMVGFTVSVTPGNAPGWAREDPWLGPWLDNCRRLPDGDQTILWRDTEVFRQAPDEDSSPVALLNAAATRTSGLVNPRYFYGPVDPRDEAAVALSRSIGAEHLPALDLGSGPIQCHRLDHGPAGMLGTVRRLIARDSGGIGGTSPDRTAQAEALRLALRQFHNPEALADNPLARGPRETRAARLEAEIRSAVDHAFGESPVERLLRETLLRGYLNPDASHDDAAHSLHLSRSTYFRRLREATDRLIARFSRGR